MTRRPFAAHVARLLVLLAMTGACAACDARKIHLGDGQEGGSCGSARVNADQVLWIGDSWVIDTRVTDLARASGAIGQNEDYALRAMPGAFMADIANQYIAQQAGPTKVKVLVMDGGIWDTLLAGGSASSVESVVSSFGQLLTRIANDGTVEHIVYVLLPELPGLPGVAALRPRLQQLCTQSTVPCHFIDLGRDLDPAWADHSEYTIPGLIPVPTDVGSRVIAGAIWAVMKQKCIAQ